jgi:predicted RNA-binding Zn-ribbon protein involved in translation (DUF1610 family)
MKKIIKFYAEYKCPKCGSKNVWVDINHEGCDDCGWWTTLC